VSDYSFSPRARRDLYEIFDYLSERSPRGAERVRQTVLRAVQRLAEQPGLGHRREDLTARPLKFWSVMGRYTIVYRGDARAIEIVRVFGPGRDIESALR